MNFLAQGCTEISGPESNWCPGVTPPDILAATGGDIGWILTIAAVGVALLACGAAVKWLMEGRHR